MPLDPSIALKTESVNPTNLISGFLDLGLKKVGLDRQRATYDADVAKSQAESNVAVGTQQPRIAQAQSQAGTASAQMSQAQLANLRDHTANMVQQLETLRNDPQISRGKVVQSIVDSAMNVGAPTAAIAQALQGLPDGNDPQALKQFVTQGLVRAQQASAHLNSIAPPPTMVNNGQQITPVASGNPAVTGVPAGTPQGVPTQMQLPPTTPTMVGNQPAYLGPQDKPPASPVPAGPALGQVQGVEGPTQVATEHYKNVSAAAEGATGRITALETIKQEAPTANTGHGAVGDVLRKFTQAFGGDTATANDVMAKNLAVIAQQAGNTDAARALGEMGNPNYHMTKEAIEQTSQQLIGIEKKKIAAQQFFTGLTTDNPKYAQRMTEWNKVADPRLFEYAALPPEKKAEWMKRLSPGVKAELAMKAQRLHDMGVEP